MRGRVDKLRKRCEGFLVPGEEILLEAQATVKLGHLSLFGEGRAYLTDRRLVWILRSMPFVRPLLFWVPDTVTIELSSMNRLRMMRDLTRAWLWIETLGKTYQIRLGKGPYPILRDNPRTTEEWLHAIEALRSGHLPAVAEAPPPQDPGEMKLVGTLLISLFILSVPFWLAGFLLAGLPPVFFVIMGAVSVFGLVAGLFLRARR